jgi:D-3-phosphoglycerate dehydrogenase
MDSHRSGPVDALVLDLLEWIGPGRRPYAEVIDAWRTSCPRLPVWEEANGRGYIAYQHPEEGATSVSVSAAGRAELNAQRRIVWPEDAVPITIKSAYWKGNA